MNDTPPIRELKGHDILAVERFQDSTSRMIEFVVRKRRNPYGSPGDEMRLFLSEADFQKALESQGRKEIRIKRYAHIIEGHILYDKKKRFSYAYRQKEGVKSMAVYRVQRTRDYTVMSNYHLRDKNLTLKSKGLLSMILSLPDEWNYTTRGLAAICKEGVDAIGSALKELENAGYIVRRQLRGANGRITDTEYIIYERPHPKEDSTPDTPAPGTDSPDTENPDMVPSDMDTPYLEMPAELNTKESNTQKSITYGSSTDSIPFREDAAGDPPEANRREATPMSVIKSYRALIRENIEYDFLKREIGPYSDDLDEIVEIMVETVCANRKYTRVAGSDFPHEVVKSRLLKLNSEHIRFVMDCMKQNTTKIRNIKQYLLAALFNAPTTIGNYYTALVNHDMYGGS